MFHFGHTNEITDCFESTPSCDKGRYYKYMFQFHHCAELVIALKKKHSAILAMEARSLSVMFYYHMAQTMISRETMGLHLGRVNALVQELLEGEHLVAIRGPRPPGVSGRRAACQAGGVQGPAQLLGALVRGA